VPVVRGKAAATVESFTTVTTRGVDPRDTTGTTLALTNPDETTSMVPPDQAVEALKATLM
jgi:hypothetical protein